MTGRLLYEKYRKHSPDAQHWNWLPLDVREFWDEIANALHRERVVVRV